MIKPVLIDMPMPIETERLLIRPPQTGDGAATYEAKAETWDDLCQWMFWTREGLGTVEDAEEMARKAHSLFILREEIRLMGVEKDSGRPVVWTGIHDPGWEAGILRTGYWVRKSAQGKGYAQEACAAVIRYAFNTLGARRLAISHAEGNEASRKIIEKLGFIKEGVHRKACMLPDGRVVDYYHYARFDAKGLPERFMS